MCIKATTPTIKYLIGNGAKVILTNHLFKILTIGISLAKKIKKVLVIDFSIVDTILGTKDLEVACRMFDKILDQILSTKITKTNIACQVFNGSSVHQLSKHQFSLDWRSEVLNFSRGFMVNRYIVASSVVGCSR